MSYDIPQLHIPDNSPEAQVIETVVNRDQVTPKEAVLRILRNAQPAIEERTLAPVRSYGSYFGSVKGPGAHGSPESVDRYIEDQRSSW